MKEIKNYKKIRVKPSIYGMTVKGFFAFILVAILALTTLIGGISFLKIMLLILLIGGWFFFCKIVLTEEFSEKHFQSKLPKKYSNYE